MRKALLFLLICASFCAAQQNTPVDSFVPTIYRYHGPPPAAINCLRYQVGFDDVANNIYTCSTAGVWTLTAGSGGGSMTWPAAPGIAVYGGSNAWGTSLAAPAGTIVGTIDAQSLTNKNLNSGTNTFPTFNQSTTGNAATATAFASLPTNCGAGSAAIGILANGNATGCFTPSGAGTVTQVTSGNFSPLFTVGVATNTSTPAFTFTASTAAANTVFGNFTGAPAAPTFTAAPTFSAANLTNFPTFNQNTTGTASALTSTPTNCGAGIAAIGILANGNATGCFTPGGLTNPMTTLGDVIYGGAAGAATRLAGPTATNSVPQFLQETPSSGAAVAPVWAPAGVPTNAQVGTTYTVAATDRASYVTFSNAGAIAVTLPQAGTTGFASNFVTIGCDIGAGTATITPTTSTISSSNGSAYTSAAASLALTTGQCAWIYSDNTNYFAIVRSGGSGGLSGMTAGQVPIAATASTVTSSEALAGAGAGITTGPASAVTTLDVTEFTGTGGQIADSGVLVANLTQTTATPSANQICVYGSTAKTCTPTTTLPTAAEPAHTGDVTNSAGSTALAIAANAVTLAKMATQTNATLLSNVSGGTAVPSANALPTTANALIKTSNANGALAASLTTDDGTTSTYTGTGGTKSPVFTSTGTTAGFHDYPQGPTSAAVAPCNTATSICEQAPTAVTSYLVTKPGAAGSGVRIGVNASSVITENFSSAFGAVTQSAKTAAVTTFTVCSATANTACGQAGQYRLTYNVWGSGTACATVTAGSMALNFTWTDENAVTHTTINAPMWDQKTAAMTSGQVNFNTALGTEGGSGSFIVSTNGTIIQAATTYTACTSGTGTYNVRITTEQLQ